ncbi:homoserine/homoserine lactone efflux protein [Agromyces terreus]|uniref:Homoserine/homoserine lactone efflux protein n=1 Tax=Agromyces terreus TaxID=424795 RepID=A0A9X2KCI8_9MICO|nr:LysE family transporter [Agromyces terreus]MCP2372488.1 homoserine/homoserine lactone efflux protein [Agromyces terreus]
MSFSVWVALLAASVVISFTPGAGAVNTMGNALKVGLRRSIWGILGQQAALVVHIVVVAAGLGVLVANSPVAFDAIRYAGAAYLVYLGIRQFLAKPVVTAPVASAPVASAPVASTGEADASGGAELVRTGAETAAGTGASVAASAPAGAATVAAPARAASGFSTESSWSLFRRGLLVNLSNPKAIVFFLAFLPQFIRPDAPLLPQYLIVGATVIAVDIAVMWGFFALAARSFRRATTSARGQTIVNRVFGSLFLIVGVALAAIH